MASCGGTISTHLQAKLKIANTVFTENKGYDIFHYSVKNNFINKIETYNCLFKHGSMFLISNVKNFKDVAVKENFFGQYTTVNQSLFEIRETPYASSKIYFSY